MKRMTLSMICVLTFIGIALSASSAMADDDRPANATVSFGQWKTDLVPPLDRLLGNPGMGVGNNHELLPNVVKIKAGDAVNFIISGLHNPTVYDDGTQPGDINPAALPLLGGAGGGIINDANNRLSDSTGEILYARHCAPAAGVGVSPCAPRLPRR